MSGKGSEIGFHFQHIQNIIQQVPQSKQRLGVCLDTCHLHDAGYDMGEFDSLLTEIESLIGLEYIKAIHINDSKNKQGEKKDRHENIGYGHIGFEKLLSVIYHPKLEAIPKILETPWVEEFPPYKEEISMIRNRLFDANLKV
jgi:deoxyribonuclease-4